MPKSMSAAERYSGSKSRYAMEDTDIGGFLDILRRHVAKILITTAVALALALAYLAVSKPVYTSTASLYIDPINRKVLSDTALPGEYGTDLAFIESQAEVITSASVLKRAVDKLGLANDPEYASSSRPGLLSRAKSFFIARPPAVDATAAALNTLANSIVVKRAQKTYVVDVDVTASTPAKAATIAGGVLDAYLAEQLSAKSEQSKRANALLDARLGELRTQVQKAETRFDEYKRAHKILTASGSAVTEQQLTKLNGELATARAVTAEAKARYDQIQATLKSGAGPATLPDALRSGLIQKLREQYAQVARREAALASQLQPRHPVLIDVRSQLAEVRKQIDAELKRIAASSGSEYQVALNRERDLSAQLDKAKEDVTHLNTAEIKARELQQDVETSRELMRVFLQRAKETQEQQNISIADARVITPPALPARPSRPVPLLILGLGLIGGLGLGLAWALTADHLDESLRSPVQLAEETGLSAVSPIPALGVSRGSGRRKGRDLFVDVPQAAQFSDLLTALNGAKGRDAAGYRQAILRLLSRIKAHQRPGCPHTVMMVSPRAGTGNSATTLAVAHAAALAGERVLLIDATSANPDLSKVFATSLKPTNVVVLDSKDHLDRITTRDQKSGLAFLPIALADLRRLKTKQRLRLVAGLNGLSQSYDLIFIDAGGVLDDEALTSLLPVADQVLVVARAGVTSRDDMADTMNILEPAHERIAGAILTMSDGDTA